MSNRSLVTIAAGLALIGAGCGDDANTATEGSHDTEQPTVVVTTSILGDVVENLAGDEFDVVTIMPAGADPHDFQPSAQEVEQIGDAEAVIANGADFELGLVDVIAAAEDDGVPIFEAISAVETLHFGDDQSDEGEEDHSEEGGDDHGHDGVDPHFFTDPARMAVAADAITEFLLANVDGIDADTLNANTQAYVEGLETLDAEVVKLVSVIPDDGRVLVTNHEVFGYFADRYDFEVVGAIIPSGSTGDAVSAQELTDLAEVIVQEDVAAIFADTASSDELAQTLADEVGDIEVVELYSESLGPEGSDGDTYLGMVQTNAKRIADALSD